MYVKKRIKGYCDLIIHILNSRAVIHKLYRTAFIETYGNKSKEIINLQIITSDNHLILVTARVVL